MCWQLTSNSTCNNKRNGTTEKARAIHPPGRKTESPGPSNSGNFLDVLIGSPLRVFDFHSVAEQIPAFSVAKQPCAVLANADHQNYEFCGFVPWQQLRALQTLASDFQICVLAFSEKTCDVFLLIPGERPKRPCLSLQCFRSSMGTKQNRGATEMDVWHCPPVPKKMSERVSQNGLPKNMKSKDSGTCWGT